ncbi:MAG: glycosyltransferase family 9 protein [Fimbriimonadales bacterium]|nr:glycosyltransferase family 9 protein [Fimbriimonadales bacterium]
MGPRFLILRFSAIGDCVMALPVASRIRRSVPGAVIDWVVDRRCADVIDTERLVNGLETFDSREEKRLRWTPAGIARQMRFYLRLRERGYDYGIDLQGHSKTALCLRIARPARRVAARATDGLARALNPVRPDPHRAEHMVEQNLETLGYLGFASGDPTPMLPDLTAERETLKAQLPDRPLVTITVGAGHPNKVVPLDRWRTVGELLMKEGLAVGYLGGPGDPSPELPGSIDWVGRLPLRQTMAALALSALHLSGDTGTAHIASALGVPTVTVFGHMPQEKFRPYWGRGKVLSLGGNAALVPQSAIFAAAQQMWRELRA